MVSSSPMYVTRFGEYNMNPVVLKRLAAAERASDNEVLMARFMDEIRLCSTLEHPKIVEFVGVMWSCSRDVTLVSEYIEGGSLSALLLSQPSPSSPHDWFEPWTPTQTIKCKAMIARDVAEAIVYLHSFSTPILHRNLKTRSVLLDSTGNAKLSNFGINRELSVEEMMSSSVDTVAWIAPEVLRGGQFSEQSDVYSLGVLLAELDRCRPVYAENAVIESGHFEQPSSRQLTNKQIAEGVISGHLHPSVSEDCPGCVKDLVARCVSFDAADRPTSMGVHFALRKMLQTVR